MTLRRHYLDLDSGRQLHYLRAGAGLPVVLLHPSPLSASFLAPLIRLLAEDFDVIAVDTPGYGCSDPLPDPGEDLVPYAQLVGEVLEKLKLDRALVYGNATGAQLAIEAAKAHEALIAALVLENAGCFSESEREQLLPDYFPDLSPAEDGSHLAIAWQVAQQLYQYFPWYDTSEAARYRETGVSLELVQATALAYLQAGTDYARAYRAAFNNERPEQLAAVAQPVQVILWQDSMLLPYSRRLQAAGMPENIQFIEVPAGIEARYAAVKQALLAAREVL